MQCKNAQFNLLPAIVSLCVNVSVVGQQLHKNNKANKNYNKYKTKRIPLFQFKEFKNLIDVSVYCVTKAWTYFNLSLPNTHDLFTAGFSSAFFLLLFRIKDSNIPLWNYVWIELGYSILLRIMQCCGWRWQLESAWGRMKANVINANNNNNNNNIHTAIKLDLTSFSIC